MRLLGNGEINANTPFIHNGISSGLTCLVCIFNLLKGYESKATGDIGPLIHHYGQLFNGPKFAKYVAQISLRSAQTKTKDTQHIGRLRILSKAPTSTGWTQISTTRRSVGRWRGLRLVHGQLAIMIHVILVGSSIITTGCAPTTLNRCTLSIRHSPSIALWRFSSSHHSKIIFFY